MMLTSEFLYRCNPTVYHMLIKNTGVVSVEWVFQFPNDLEVSPGFLL